MSDIYITWDEYNKKIEELAIIGIGSTLTTNLKIGKKSIISVGSSVVKDVPHNSIIEGVPGKIIGKRKP